MACYNGHRNEEEPWHLQIATGSQENHGTSCDMTMATERHESHGMLQWTQKGRRVMTHGHRRARESWHVTMDTEMKKSHGTYKLPQVIKRIMAHHVT